jgi:hypothetical protein
MADKTVVQGADVPGLDPAVAAAIGARDHAQYAAASARAEARLSALLSTRDSVVIDAETLLTLARSAERMASALVRKKSASGHAAAEGFALSRVIDAARQAVAVQRPEYGERRELEEENALAMQDVARAGAAKVEVECPDCDDLTTLTVAVRESGDGVCAHCGTRLPALHELMDGAD